MSEMGAAAVQLRVTGASFADVATTLGLSNPKSAIRLVTRELSEQAQEDTDAFERMRAEESARLEALMLSVWSKASDPDSDEHLVAVRTAVAIIKQHSTLHGLDAPAEVVVHTPTATELDQWVSAMVSQSMPQLEEAPLFADDGDVIIEAEVVE